VSGVVRQNFDQLKGKELAGIMAAGTRLDLYGNGNYEEGEMDTTSTITMRQVPQVCTREAHHECFLSK